MRPPSCVSYMPLAVAYTRLTDAHVGSPPPGLQFMHERWSLVYFLRPNNNVYLKALSDKSPSIEEAVKNAPTGVYFPGVTAVEWFTKRQKQHRTDSGKVSP